MTIQHRTVDIEAASKLWKEDLSASQIAKRFGVSRNVIVGIAFRNRAFFLQSRELAIAGRTKARGLRGRTKLQCATANRVR